MGKRIKRAITLCLLFVIVVILNILGFSALIFASINSFLLIGLGHYVGIAVETKFAKAKQGELKREDDVMLSSRAFSLAILVVIANQMPNEKTLNTTLLMLAIIVAAPFYALRAWAKVKNSQKHRYYSMVAFAYLSTYVAISFTALAFEMPDTLFSLSTIYIGIPTAFAIIAGKIARRRYGYRGSLLSTAN